MYFLLDTKYIYIIRTQRLNVSLSTHFFRIVMPSLWLRRRSTASTSSKCGGSRWLMLRWCCCCGAWHFTRHSAGKVTGDMFARWCSWQWMRLQISKHLGMMIYQICTLSSDSGPNITIIYSLLTITPQIFFFFFILLKKLK